jgi:hypothetical protein
VSFGVWKKRAKANFDARARDLETGEKAGGTRRRETASDDESRKTTRSNGLNIADFQASVNERAQWRQSHP